MLESKFSVPLVAIVVALLSASIPAARADFALTDGMGEEIQYRNPRIGKKVKAVKTRFGNSYVSEQGLLGNKSTQVSVLGNSFEKKKGLLGSSEIGGSTIFGDRVVSKKGWFGLGRRKTQVDLSGTSAVLRNFIGQRPVPQIQANPLPSMNESLSPRQDETLPQSY